MASVTYIIGSALFGLSLLGVVWCHFICVRTVFRRERGRLPARVWWLGVGSLVLGAISYFIVQLS